MPVLADAMPGNQNVVATFQHILIFRNEGGH
jgi:hypothetical protein